MKQHFKVSIIVNLIIVVTTYLVISFICWDFYNPIKWILKIPELSPDIRGAILGIVVLYQLLVYIYVSLGIMMYRDKKSNS